MWRTSRPKQPPGMDPLGRLGSAEIEEERRTLGAPSAIAPCPPPTLRPRPGSPGREARRVYEGVGAPTMPATGVRVGLRLRLRVRLRLRLRVRHRVGVGVSGQGQGQGRW